MYPEVTRMRVFVTGGAGFIGSHVCDVLISNDYEVVCFDILNSNEAQNVAHLSDSRCFTYMQGDVRNEEDLRVAMRGCTHVTVTLPST